MTGREGCQAVQSALSMFAASRALTRTSSSGTRISQTSVRRSRRPPRSLEYCLHDRNQAPLRRYHWFTNSGKDTLAYNIAIRNATRFTHKNRTTKQRNYTRLKRMYAMVTPSDFFEKLGIWVSGETACFSSCTVITGEIPP